MLESLEWCALSQRFTDGSINQWRHRIQAVLQENGGHIEQKFNYLLTSLLYNIVVCCIRYKR